MASKTGGGKLRIGNQWNAIRIIALSQSNPLKAIAEFVENSIDAGATKITIVRGKSRGEQYVKVIDNGVPVLPLFLISAKTLYVPTVERMDDGL